MQEKEFNLLEEPWIRVLTNENETREVSLIEALVQAQDFRSLSGETPAQDFAMLRLLLACAITVFYRYDAEGNYEPITEDDFDEDEVLERWSAYWDMGQLPEEAVREYFKKYAERFWLFHPETPFYQVANLEYGTEYKAQCLYGDIKISNNEENTKYHFSLKEGQRLRTMSYNEASRWLININGFGVQMHDIRDVEGSTKTKGPARLGRLGILFISGETLFESIMLNATMLKENGDIWGHPAPVWETDAYGGKSRTIPPVDNLPELYTIQSRRVMLRRDNGIVTGFKARNGDMYSDVDIFTEPMTIWGCKETRGRKTYSPRQHSYETQIWREFPAIFYTEGQGRRPGIIMWEDIIEEVLSERKKDMLTLNIIGVKYGNFIYEDCFSDGMTFSSELFKDIGEEWVEYIKYEIENNRKTADDAIGRFVNEVMDIIKDPRRAKSQKKNDNVVKSRLKERYYSKIDVPFRNWLMSIRPSIDRKDESLARWEKEAYRCADEVVRDYIESLGENKYRFRETDAGIISVPGAYSEFIRNLRNIYRNVNEPASERSGEDGHGT